MRIGILCHDSFGGSTRVATELASGLARAGHHVHLFAYSPPFGRWTAQRGVTLHTLHPSRQENLHSSSLHINWSTAEREAFVKSIIQVIKSDGLDILHFHYAVPFAHIISEIRQRLGRKSPIMMGTLHGTDVTVYGRQQGVKKERLIQELIDLDGLTTVSLSHAKLSQEVFGLPTMPMVIPNFVDTIRFHPSTTPHSNLDKPKIIHVSNFRDVKRILDVARIFAGLRQQMEAELWLIGDGENMAPAKQFFNENGLTNIVRFWGLQRDISSILNQADLLLVTSQHESFCLVALEAMACAVPVLATDVGGLPEVVSNGESGLLFPVGDCKTAVSLASTLLSNPNRHQAMGKAGRTRALTYGFEHIIPRYEALYRQLLLENDRN